MATQNPFDDPKLGADLAPANPFDDPNLGQSRGVVGGFTAGVRGTVGSAAQAVGAKTGLDSLEQWGKGQEAKAAPTEEESLPVSAARAVGGMVGWLPAIAGTLAALPEVPEALGGTALAYGLNAARGAAGMLAPAAANKVNAYADLKSKGVDDSTAEKSSWGDFASTLATGAVPVAATGNLALRGITGAASQVAIGEANRQLQNKLLESHPELQEEFSAKNAATNAIVGGFLGGILGHNKPLKESIGKAKDDAQAALDANDPAATAPLALPNLPVYVGGEAQPKTPEQMQAEAAADANAAQIYATRDAEEQRRAAAFREAPIPFSPATPEVTPLSLAGTEGNTPNGLAFERHAMSNLTLAEPGTALTEASSPFAGQEDFRSGGFRAAMEAQLAAKKATEQANATPEAPAPEPVVRNTQLADKLSDAIKQNQIEQAHARNQETLLDQKAMEEAKAWNIHEGELQAQAALSGQELPIAMPNQKALEGIAAAVKDEGVKVPRKLLAKATTGSADAPDMAAKLRAQADEWDSKGARTNEAGVFRKVADYIDPPKEEPATNEQAQTEKAAEAKPGEAQSEIPVKENVNAIPEPSAGTLSERTPREAGAEKTGGVQSSVEGPKTAAESTPAGNGKAAPKVRPKTQVEAEQSGWGKIRPLNRDAMGLGKNVPDETHLGENIKTQADHDTEVKVAQEAYKANPTKENRDKAVAAIEAGREYQENAARETPKPEEDLLLSKTGTPIENPASRADIHAEAVKLFGGEEAANRVVIHVTDPERQIPAAALKSLRDEEARTGEMTTVAFAHDGKMYVMDGQIVKGQERAIILHEAGVHLGMEKLIGADKVGKLAEQVRDWANGNGDAQEVALSQKVMDSLRMAAPHEAHVDQETVAYFVQHAVESGIDPIGLKQTGTLAAWMRRIWSAMKTALEKLGINPASLRAEDIVNLAHAATVTHGGDLLATKGGSEIMRAARAFNASPAGAAQATDSVLSRAIKTATETVGKLANVRDMDATRFKMMMGWQTTGFMEHTVETDPRIVKQMLPGMQAIHAAHDEFSKVSKELTDRVGSYATHVSRALDRIKGAAARRDASESMGYFAGESSRRGVDLRSTYEANIKRDPSLKNTVSDQDFRQMQNQFTAFEQKHPELAKAIDEGAKINRELYQNGMATRIATLLRSLPNKDLLEHIPLLDYRNPANKNIGARLDDVFKAARELPKINDLTYSKLSPAERVQHDAATSRLNPENKTRFAAGERAKTEATLDSLNKIGDSRITPEERAAQGAQENTRAMMREMEKVYRAQSSAPYFHLGRSGDYFVRAKFKDMDQATFDRLQAALRPHGKVLGDVNAVKEHGIFLRAESSDEALGLRDKIIQNSNGFAESPATSGLLEKSNLQTAAGLNSALKSVLDTMTAHVDDLHLEPEQALALKQLVTRDFLSMLPETSSRKGTLPRTGVPGYEGNFIQNFSDRGNGMVQDITHSYTSHTMSQAYGRLRKGVDDVVTGGDHDAAVRAGAINNEMALRYAQSMQPIKSDMVNLINSFGHSFYLALSPAFLLRTMAQPFHRGLPYLGSQFGYVKSAKTMGGTTKDVLQIVANTFRNSYAEGGIRGVMDAQLDLSGTNLSKTEREFFMEAQARGAWNLGQAYQLSRMAMGQSARAADAARMMAMTAQYAEMTNRMVVGLAAHRLNGGDIEHAITASKRVMDSFDQGYTARQIGKHSTLPTGTATPLAASFMNYNLQTMEQVIRTVNDGFLNRDKSEAGILRAKQARREFGGLLATTTMLAGALGLPFANAAAGLYNTVQSWIDPDHPEDIRDSLRNMLSDTFGKDVGEVLAHGVPRALGVDTSTTGLQNLLPGSEFMADRRLWKDRIESQGIAILGPALNAILDVGAGVVKLNDGYYTKGLEAMLPSGLKALYKGMELATQGFTDSKGNPAPGMAGVQPTWGEIATQSIGFAPSRKAEATEASMSFNATESRLANRKQILGDMFYKASRPGADPGDRAEVLAQIRAFNRANPTDAITDLAAIFREHAIKNAIARSTGTGVGVSSPRAIPRVQDVRYANTQ